MAAKAAYEKGYRVQGDGSVISPSGARRKLMRGRGGYPKISVKVTGKSYPVLVHMLAAYQLYGESSFVENIEVRHLNDNKSDSRLCNIAIGSKHDNRMDIPPEVRRRLATSAASHLRKVTDDQIADMHVARVAGDTLQAIADRYDLVKSTVHRILSKSPRPKP